MMTQTNRHPRRTFPRGGWIAVLIMLGILAAAHYFRGGNRGQWATPTERGAAIDFALNDLDGRTFRISDHRGQVVMINYWATWCPPCRNETPDLVKIAREYAPRGLAAIGISLDQAGEDAVRRFVKQYDIPYPIAMATQDPQISIGISAIPVTLLLDKQGRVAQKYVGAGEEKALRSDVERLMAER